MVLPKIKTIFVGIIIPLLINNFSPVMAFEIERVKGNCRPFNCNLLLKDLQAKWQWQIDEWLDSGTCKDKEILGLNVWEKNKKERVVSFICWGETDKSQKVSGNYLGILPFPGEEKNFGSKWNCLNDSECENSLQLIQSQYQQKVRELEIRCGLENGELRLLKNEDKVDVQCVYFVPSTQIDTNLDGISDGEIFKPTGVDVILYQF